MKWVHEPKAFQEQHRDITQDRIKQKHIIRDTESRPQLASIGFIKYFGCFRTNTAVTLENPPVVSDASRLNKQLAKLVTTVLGVNN